MAMVERGLYYATAEFKTLIQSLGGECSDPKRRPMVCLIKSTEDPRLYWAIPMGNLDHRTNEQQQRILWFINLPDKDICSCYYHIGRTTARSIFFISDAIPITDKYIDCVHMGADNKPYVIKNANLISELQRKLFRILSYENANRNHFRQRITDIKLYLLDELHDKEK